MSPKSSKNKNRLMLATLFLLFFGPFIGASILYKTHPTWAGKTVNKGVLIQPPLILSELVLKSEDKKLIDSNTFPHKWLMMYLTSEQCKEACLKSLYDIRQVRTALGKDRDRVERVLVTVDGIDTTNVNSHLQKEYLGTSHWFISSYQWNKLNSNLPHTKAIAATSSFLIVDPLGNVILYYPADAPPEHMLKDLSHLLKLSHIG